MKPVTFIPPADEDFAEAISFYESRSIGMGRKFAARVCRALAEISEFPQRYQVVLEGTRRCLLPPFPFGLFYVDKPDRVVVIAIVDLRRHPDVWKRRM